MSARDKPILSPALREKLDGVWVDLLCLDPFASALLLNCRQEISATVTKTMATDGESLWINPECLASETRGGLMTMLAHEALHIAALHPFRCGQRDPKAWNIATDKEVNGTLEGINSEGKIKYTWPTKYPGIMPAPSEIGMAAEQLYVEPPQGDNGGDNGDQDGDDDSQGDGWGGVRAPSNDPGELAEKESRAKMQIAQAAELANQQGRLPAALARLVDTVLNPETPWQDILRAWIREHAKDDYSWTRPNPRYAQSGFILPSLHSQRLGKIAVTIDTSGSIDGEMLNKFLGEVQGIMHECRPEKLVLIDCDAAVNSIRELEPTDEIPRDFTGGGGTDFRPAMEAMQSDPPVAMIYLTDLEGEFGEDPGFPVLWAATTDNTAPYGQTIRIK